MAEEQQQQPEVEAQAEAVSINCVICSQRYSAASPIELCSECDRLHCERCATWRSLADNSALSDTSAVEVADRRFVCAECAPDVQHRFDFAVVKKQQEAKFFSASAINAASSGTERRRLELPTAAQIAQPMKDLLQKLRPKEESQQDKQSKERKEREIRIKGTQQTWLEEIIPNWEKKKDSKAVRTLCWGGIPPNLRNQVWSLLIGNKMGITPELFQIHGRRAFEARSKARDSKKRFGSEEFSKEDTVNLIPVDIGRTYPKLGFFQVDGPQHEELRLVLEAYVCLRPDIGYVQGMSFLAAGFLLNMNLDDSFRCLSNMLNAKIFVDFYRMNMINIQKYVLILEEFMAKFVPKVLSHFEELQLVPNMYIIDWVLTLFSKSLPLDIAGRIWDNYFANGIVFIFRTAIGIFRYGEQVLAYGDLEDCLTYLGKLDLKLSSESDLFEKHIKSINISQRQMNEMLEKYNLL